MFAYQQEDGSVAVCSLVSSVPAGAQYIETTNAPEDKLFRSAWELGTDSIATNLDKAKEIVHGRRRAKREIAFAPHDEIISKQIPGKDVVAAESARSDIRLWDDALQLAINGKLKESTLRTLMEQEELL